MRFDADSAVMSGPRGIKKCVVDKLRSRAPVRAQFIKAGRVTKLVKKFLKPSNISSPNHLAKASLVLIE